MEPESDELAAMAAQRLAAAVLRRREELGRNQLEVQGAGGPSNTTLTKIEGSATDPKPLNLSGPTLRKLDEGLDWPPGTARGIWQVGPRNQAGDRRPRVLRKQDLHGATNAELLQELQRRLSEGRQGASPSARKTSEPRLVAAEDDDVDSVEEAIETEVDS